MSFKNLTLLFICLLAIPVLIFSESCKKKAKFILHGAVFNKCGEPYANALLEIRQRGTAYYTKASSGGPIGTTKTDGSGNFTFEYTALTELDSLSIFDGQDATSLPLMSGIPANSNEQVFVYKTMTLEMIIKAAGIIPVGTNDSMYTRKDSLIIGGEHIFYGAFRNGQEAGRFTINADVSNYNYLKQDYSLIWGIGWTNYILHYITYKHYDEGFGVIHYKIKGCDEDNIIDISLTGL